MSDNFYDGPTYKSKKVVSKPIDHFGYGHYAASGVTNTMAAGLAANSEILQFRWTDATRFAVIQEVRIDAMNSLGTGFTAGIAQFDLTIARGWSADGTGGGLLTLTGDNQKQRTANMGSPLAAIRMATTAALGAGTKNLDANRLSYTRLNISTATNNVFIGAPQAPVYLLTPDTGSGQHPIVLAQNEGFVIRATVPATGTWDIYLGIRWAEVLVY